MLPLPTSLNREALSAKLTSAQQRKSNERLRLLPLRSIIFSLFLHPVGWSSMTITIISICNREIHLACPRNTQMPRGHAISWRDTVIQRSTPKPKWSITLKQPWIKLMKTIEYSLYTRCLADGPSTRHCKVKKKKIKKKKLKNYWMW